MLTLVTGATGLVGNNVVRLLLEQGGQVRVLARAGCDERPLTDLNVEVAAGDVRDAEAVRRASAGVNHVVHAAGRVHLGWSGLELQQAINVEGTRHVAVAARAAGARLIHVSSVDALGLGTRESPGTEDSPPEGSVPCPYVLTKRAAEQVVLDEIKRGLDAVIVNPAYMLGPWDWKPSSGRMLLQIAKGWALMAPPGGNDFCDVRDVAAGILAAAQRGVCGRRYILGGEALSYLDAWRMMARIAGVRGPWRNARRPVLMMAGRAGDLWRRVSGHEPDVNSAAVAMSILPHHFSSARAQAELGYRARPAVEAATAAWQWFIEHGYATSRRKKSA